MTRGGWVYVGGRAGNKPAATEKAAITSACERFIIEVLKPRFLPEIRPTKFNYPIDIYGKWHGNKYRFITRYRSDDPCSDAPEFEAAFARLEYLSRDRFDLSWQRHTSRHAELNTRVALTGSPVSYHFSRRRMPRRHPAVDERTVAVVEVCAAAQCCASCLERTDPSPLSNTAVLRRNLRGGNTATGPKGWLSPAC